MSKEVNARLQIPGASPGEVWPLLSQADMLKQWFCEGAEVDLPADRFRFWGRFTPDTPGQDSEHVRLSTWSAPDAAGQDGRLGFSWILRGQDTKVEIALSPLNGGTELLVNHSALGERLNSKGAVHDFWYSVLENLRLLALTGRPQTLPEYGPKPGSSLMLQVDIAAPAEEIFRCLIEPQWMAKLWDDQNIVVEPVVGGVYDYGWKDGGPKRVLAIDPPNLLSFSWIYPPEVDETVVTWRLVALASGLTRLSLTHGGFQADYDDEEYRAGWFSFLAIIKGICELGEHWTRVNMKGISHGEA